MKDNAIDILIIGAGLTGLALAYYLKGKGFRISILEGRNRTGGRILTVTNNETPLEMGATWISPQHLQLLGLLKELKLDIFEQKIGETAIYEPTANSPHQLVALPTNQEPSYRIKGGTNALINSLEQQIETTSVVTDCVVKSIEESEDFLFVNTNQGAFRANHVVSTLPPFLFLNTIKVNPSLPKEFHEVALNTHTWMGESIKIGLSYSEAFWDEIELSSTIFSNQGPVTEMYDHSNFEKDRFALKGFLNSAYNSISKEERLESIMRQLEKYYGPKVRQYLHYEELIWQHETLTYSPYESHLFPHQNNGHKIYRSTFFNNKLHIAGTETASVFPGYMEGAVINAKEITSRLQ